MDVGIIGTGAMGSGMAANILKAGHSVRVWDRTPQKTADLVKQGAKRVERPKGWRTVDVRCAPVTGRGQPNESHVG